MRYRPDIDGLRATAVSLVVGFHAFPSRLPGGYIGVDVFFVISGFLITGLILHDLEAKEFSFREFYARRVRRIFPALAAVLVTSFLFGWLLLLPNELESLGWNILGAAAFASNFVLLRESGYFDISAAQKPLLHLWSLGVEEQFYLAWPILLVLTFSARRSISVLAFVVLILSFAWNVQAAGSLSDFYLPFTRAWELMLGCLMAAFAHHSEQIKLTPVLRLITPRGSNYSVCIWPETFAFAGVGLIVAAVVALDQQRNFPGWWALLPTVGACLIISSSQSWFNRSILSAPAIVLIGLISYPLYLWHWPLLSFVSFIDPAAPAYVRLVIILVAAVLAGITYQWIEKPLRRGQYRTIKIAGLCATMAGLAGLGLITSYERGFDWRLPSAVRYAANMTPDMVAEWRIHKCLLETDDTQFAPECGGNGGKPLLFLWGDSFAGALYPGLKNLQRSVNFDIAQYNAAGCPPVLSFQVEGRPHCSQDNEFAFSALMRARPDLVVLDSSWAWLYGNFTSQLSELIAKLRKLNVPRIVIVGPLPERIGGLPRAFVDYYRTHHAIIPQYSSFRVYPSWFDYQRRFKQQASKLAEYISLWDAFCNEMECLTRVGEAADELVAFDDAHLTVRGAVYIAQKIAPCLFPGSDLKLSASDKIDLTRVCSQKEASTGGAN